MNAIPDFARCDAFWARAETDRPLIATRVGDWTSEDHYPNGLASLPDGQLQPADFDVAAFWPDYELLYARHAATVADVPWAAFPPFPMPWLEAIIGCPVYHRAGAIWAGHWLESYALWREVDVTPANPWLAKLLEFTEGLAALSAERFPVALALMRGPLDLLSALRGPQQMVFDLFDEPQAVDQMLQRLAGIWRDVARLQMARIPSFHGGYGFSVINLWARQPCGWFQDDAIALLSPTYYRRFLRDREAWLAQSLPITGIHLHPAPLFTVDELLAMPALKVIEVNLDVNGPPLARLIPQFQRILQRKNLAIWGEFSRDDFVLLRDSLPRAGLAVQIMAPSAAQVQASIADLHSAYARRHRASRHSLTEADLR